jgi:DNA-binding beta-propeller fold protein YncE
MIPKALKVVAASMLGVAIHGASLAPLYAQIINGAPAIDGLGQYDQVSFTEPNFVFDKGEANDGPNKLGFRRPHGVVVDATNRRLFVSDSQANRILVFPLGADLKPSSRFPQNVLGQSDFWSGSSGSGVSRLNFPQQLAYSPSRNLLFVVDAGNNRVLVFDVASISDGESAINVIGQPNFTSTTATVSAAGVGSAQGVALDDAGNRLFVSSSYGSRVTVFDIAAISDGQAAVNVLGKANFTDDSTPSNATSQNLAFPQGLAFDATHGRLFVADASFHRVTAYDVNIVTNNEAAANVVCQAIMTTKVIGATASQCNTPVDVAYDGTNDTLYVSDSVNDRINVYLDSNPAELGDGKTGSAFLGQIAPPNSTGATSQSRVQVPAGITLTANNSLLYVSDGLNARVMVFDVTVAATNENAVDMLGQYDETSYASPALKYSKSGRYNTPNKFGLGDLGGDVEIDTVHNRLFVSDTGNSRVLVFALNAQHELESKVPVAVLGQTDFASSAVSATQGTFSNPTALAYDSVNDRLFVSDPGYNRVLVFDTTSISDGEPAVAVLGQPNFTSSGAALTQSGLSASQGLAMDEANQRLFVGDLTHARVLVYDVASITNGENAVAVLGQADFTSSVVETSATRIRSVLGISFDPDTQRLFVVDNNSNRVVVYDVTEVSNGEAAVAVLCQGSFTGAAAGLTASACSNPGAVKYDAAQKVLYVADGSNRRVLAFDASSITDGEEAVRVLGQTDFTSSTISLSANSFNPTAIALSSSGRRLYVFDFQYNRVLVFPTRYAFGFSSLSFSEATANDGSVSSTATITLEGDSFFASSGTLTRGQHYTVSGLPEGLTEVITLDSAQTATLSFTGAATAHALANSVSAVTITFLDAALQAVPASSVDGFSQSISITFSDPPLCFGGALPKPKLKIKGRTVSVLLPTGIVPSASCTILATGNLKKPKKAKTRKYAVGKQIASITKLTRGRWSFGYSVTTVARGTKQSSSVKTATIR